MVCFSVNHLRSAAYFDVGVSKLRFEILDEGFRFVVSVMHGGSSG